MTSIDDGAFSYCYALTSITIPEGVTTISENTFYNCTSLTTVYYGGTRAQWNEVIVGSSNEPLLNARVICTDDPVTMGDINYDGQVNVRDVIILLDTIAARTTGKWATAQQTAADVNSDGRISVRDALLILDAIAAQTTNYCN